MLNNHLKAEKEISRLHLKKTRNKVYIAMEYADFEWSEQEVRDFRMLWRNDISLVDIAAYFNRDQDEVGVLVIDQRKKGFIEPRENGIWSKKELEISPKLN